MTLFDFTRAGAVFNALDAAREASARDARQRHHHWVEQPAPASNRRQWRARVASFLSLIFG